MDQFQAPVVWEPSAKLHLTLNFLGELPDEAIARLYKKLSPVIAAFPAFSLTPTFLETLYHRHEPSLIYLAPRGDISILTDLQKAIRQALNDLRLPQTSRFMPHIVVGRLKRTDPVATKTYLDQLGTYEPASFSPFSISRITLYESHLTKVGSFYQRVHSFALS